MDLTLQSIQIFFLKNPYEELRNELRNHNVYSHYFINVHLRIYMSDF